MIEEHLKNLNKIYEKVSSGECAGCAKCCSESVGASFVEAEVIFDFIKNMDTDNRKYILSRMMNYYFEVYDNRLKCPFLDEKNLCSIYEHRPLNCRVYGHWNKLEYNNNLERLKVQNVKIASSILTKYGYKVSDDYLAFEINYCDTFKGDLFSLDYRNELYDELIVLDSKYFVKNKILTAYEDKGIVEHIVERIFSRDKILDLKFKGKLTLKLRRRLITLADYRIGVM